MERSERIIAGLDLGTTKMCVVIGRSGGRGGLLDVLGVGVSDSYGIRKGVVVNIEGLTESIGDAVEEAELMAGVEVKSLYVGVSGDHMRGANCRGVVAISSKDREISGKEVDRVIEAAQTMNFSGNRDIVHVLPWEFIIDEQAGIKDPVGMSGVRLEVNAHIVTGEKTVLQNVVKSVARAGFEVKGPVLGGLASSEAVLTEEEREVGTLLIDIGGGTTDALMFMNGGVRYSGIFPVGGRNISRDISLGLKVSDPVAEKMKLERGYCSESYEGEERGFELEVKGRKESRAISYEGLKKIIEARVEELLILVKEDLTVKKLLGGPGCGVVLTGGTSLLKGIEDLGSQVFNMPARIGDIEGVGGLKDKIDSPVYAAGVGLVRYGLRHEEDSYGSEVERVGIFKRMKNSLSDFAREFFA